MNKRLCVCGHEMDSHGAQTLEMNGSSFRSNMWTDHVDVELYICPWCGRMAFFMPEEKLAVRYRMEFGREEDEALRAVIDGDRPEIIKNEARKLLAVRTGIETKRRAEREEEKRREREYAERRQNRRGLFSGLFGGDGDEEEKPKNRPPEF